MLKDRDACTNKLKLSIASGSFVSYFACTSRKMTKRAQKRWNLDMTEEGSHFESGDKRGGRG